MPEQPSETSTKRFLEPSDRVSEVLFGLIMVLTFTGSLSVAEAQADRSEVRTMLIGALGCNIAWGIIDGILYLMGCLAEQGNRLRSWRAFKKAPNPEAAHQVISDLLPPKMAELLTPVEFEAVRKKLVQLPEPPRRPCLHKDEWLGALGVFLWVFVTTFPVTIPFIFMHDVHQAMRMSNGIAIALLFLTGYAFGRCSEYHPWLTGFLMVVLGCALVAMTMALGG
ncbi:MAG TPA: VIT1/CCC1 transporter family protein [Verrucomicrobiae bacterium]|nr:VIT1/CCC1 transporter family protein [Verrucomicrobiae bacterium]